MIVLKLRKSFELKFGTVEQNEFFVFNCFKIFNAITNQLYFNILLGLKPEEEFFFLSIVL